MTPPLPHRLTARPAVSGSRVAYLYDAEPDYGTAVVNPDPRSTNHGEMLGKVETHVLDPRHNLTVAREIARRYNAHDALVAMLSALEWSASVDVEAGGYAEGCPICEGERDISGHADGCRLAALLDSEAAHVVGN